MGLKLKGSGSYWRTNELSALCIYAAAMAYTSLASGQVTGSGTDLLDDVVTFSAAPLQVRRYVDLPSTDNRINSFTLQPGDNEAFYTTSQSGVVYRVTDNGSGSGIATEWFDAKDGGFFANVGGIFHGGMRSIAFHPDFDDATKAGYGKFYASHSTNQKLQSWSAPLIGSTMANGNPESVDSEWTYNFNAGQVDQSSYRELFRVSNRPKFDHPIKSLSFNTTAVMGDEDYGLLYLGYGDADSSQEFGGAGVGSGQDLTNALGKILRVNPLGAGAGDYTTPGNTYAFDGDSNTLAEVYSAGHRNPHNLTFAKTAGGDAKLIVAEIGQDLVEEVNIIDINMNTNGEPNGFDYGWGVREGTFVRVLGEGGYGLTSAGGSGEVLPLNDIAASNNEAGPNQFIYPSLQYDHNDPGDFRDSDAIAGGHVIDGTYYFGNFSGNANAVGSQIYSVDFEALASQKTSFDANAGEDTSDLTWIDDFTQYRLSFEGQVYDTFAELLTADMGSTQYRSDMRFGVTPDGTMLISSKRNGVVYIIDAPPQPESTVVFNSIGFDFQIAGAQNTPGAGDETNFNLIGDLIFDNTLIDTAGNTVNGLSVWVSGILGGSGESNLGFGTAGTGDYTGTPFSDASYHDATFVNGADGEITVTISGLNDLLTYDIHAIMGGPQGKDSAVQITADGIAGTSSYDMFRTGGVLSPIVLTGLTTDDHGNLVITIDGPAFVSFSALHLTANSIDGDTNGDGIVNLTDFFTLRDNFGAADVGWIGGDFNGDGIVNLTDFFTLRDNFGATSAALSEATTLEAFAAAVPEPSSMVLLGLGGFVFGLRRAGKPLRMR